MNEDAPNGSFRRWLTACISLALLGGVVLPAAAYVVGKRLVGAYEGKYGLMDYLGSIYAAAGRGDLPAWVLVLAPTLVVGVWYCVVRLWPWAGRPGVP